MDVGLSENPLLQMVKTILNYDRTLKPPED